MNFPSVAIVILNYNGRHYLEKFLPAVIKSSYPNKRIIIADNASADDSLSFIAENFHEAETILLDKNYGFAEGYNHALNKIQADYYVLLNSDVEVTIGWIEDLIRLMEDDKQIAACQPKILSYNNKGSFEYAGACGGWIDALGYTFARGRVFDICEQDNGQYNEACEIFWASGAALCVRSERFHEMKGFDGYLFAHMEEINLCWRLKRKGYKIYVCPSSVVYHVGGGTLPTGNSRKIFLNFRNNLIILLKNFSFVEGLYKIPVRILLDWVFALKSLLQGNIKIFLAVVKAHAAVIIWIFHHKKSQKLPTKRLNQLSGVYSGSIVWAYFINRTKLFSEIVQKKMLK